MQKQCGCGQTFQCPEYLKDRKKYCSKKCFYKYRKRPKGLKYVLVKENPTSFKKGQTPWNQGVPVSQERKEYYSNLFKGKRFSTRTEFTSERTIGYLNSKWKGDSVGYNGLHSWVSRRLGKAKVCEHCGTDKGRIEWANKSRDYKRTLTDWLSLCKKCHCKYDRDTWGEATKKYGLNKNKK